MRTKTGPNGLTDKHVKEIRRRTRRQFSSQRDLKKTTKHRDLRTYSARNRQINGAQAWKYCGYQRACLAAAGQWSRSRIPEFKFIFESLEANEVFHGVQSGVNYVLMRNDLR